MGKMLNERLIQPHLIYILKKKFMMLCFTKASIIDNFNSMCYIRKPKAVNQFLKLHFILTVLGYGAWVARYLYMGCKKRARPRKTSD